MFHSNQNVRIFVTSFSIIINLIFSLNVTKSTDFRNELILELEIVSCGAYYKIGIMLFEKLNEKMQLIHC